MENEREICALRNKLAALRQRIQYLEKLLSLNEPPAQSMDRTSQGAHPIRSCEYYRLLQVGDRWSVA